MSMKRIVPLIIAIELLFQVALYAEENLPKDKPGTAVFVMSVDKSKIIVESKTIEEKSKHLLIDMKIPVIKNLGNKFLQKRINNKIMKEQLALKYEVEEDAKRDYQYSKDNGLPAIPYELMTNYYVQSNDDIFSLQVTIYQFTGGAHGMTTNTYYNIDTKTNKQLELKDYFKSGSDYKGVLDNEIRKQIKEREMAGEYFFEGDWGFKGVKDDQAFYINSKGELVIVFGLYEIAPYAGGIIEFPIPTEVIQSSTKATSVPYVK